MIIFRDIFYTSDEISFRAHIGPDSDGPRSIWNLNDEDDGFYQWIYMSSNWLHNSFPELAFSLMLTK